jgi:hypothetical protein
MKPTSQQFIDRVELLCRSHSQRTVASLLKIQQSTISGMKKSGWKAKTYKGLRRALPTDFAIMSKRLTYRELMAHYRASDRTVLRWLGMMPDYERKKRGPVPRAMPADFAQRVKHLTNGGLCAHYSVSAWIIQRWKKELQQSSQPEWVFRR